MKKIILALCVLVCACPAFAKRKPAFDYVAPEKIAAFNKVMDKINMLVLHAEQSRLALNAFLAAATDVNSSQLKDKSLEAMTALAYLKSNLYEVNGEIDALVPIAEDKLALRKIADSMYAKLSDISGRADRMLAAVQRMPDLPEDYDGKVLSVARDVEANANLAVYAAYFLEKSCGNTHIHNELADLPGFGD
ncbi:MAG: hypothetical protein WCS77_10015 [Elusimicrobiaceae bacterium]|jgi:hypothetical protein